MDNVTLVKGAHTIKAGVEFRASDFDDESRISPGGSFTFTDRATGDGLATMLLGWTSAATLVDNPVISSRTDYYGAFVQDNWKVSQRLTLNFGLRWEMDTPRWEKNNRQNSVDLTAINPISGTPGIMVWAGQNGRTKYAHDFDQRNFGPHFGFAWRHGDSTVIRGGYGLTYVGAYGQALPNAMTAGFSKQGDFTSPDGGFTPAFPFRDGLPAISAFVLEPGFGAVRVGSAPRFAPQFIASNHKNGYAQHWNLSVQRLLKGSLLAEAAYLGNVGHKLPGAPINRNVIALANGRGPATQDQRLRPYPQWSGLTELGGPDLGNSTYHALNAKLEKRYSGGFNLLLNYTWAKFIDGGFEGNQHPELLRLDKALSVSDVAHRVSGSAVYELPIGRGKLVDIQNAVLNHIIGGWVTGAILELRDGTPFGVGEQTNLSNTFAPGQRSNLTGNPYLSTSRSRRELLAQYFNTAAFTAPGVGLFGSAPRTLIRGPGSISLDTSIQKRWALTERWKLQMRGDFFNLPNRPNFGQPNGSRGNANFGRITASGPGRQTQLGLRLEF